MVFKDYYKILGFDTNRVSIEEIRVAYREKAKKYHPDMNIETHDSEEIFKDINEAYRTLSNDKLRRRYDLTWYRYVGLKKNKENVKQKKTIKEFLADIFFGGINRKKVKEQKTPKYGENIVTQIDVTIEEAFRGVNKRIKLRTVDGKENHFNITVPAGIQNNDKVRIVGQGKRGKNGGRNGDLLVFIVIKDSNKLRLNGVDFVYELPLNVWEAALGTNKTIKVLDENIKIVVPKATSSGRTFVIKGKGYKNGKGERGDLHIITKIVVPEHIDDAQRAIFEKLKELNEKSNNNINITLT